jgi:uncharacterized membrane protein YraQ (UPF0718 family)
MEYIIEFWHALVELSNAMAPYILFGLLFAGILHEIVPDSLVTKHLGKASIASVIKATLFGVPLPVCSCGVIPLAAGIKKSGASKGATLSFLISTPITGIDSILATYGIFGWIFTIYRVITSMIISIAAGILTNIFATKEKASKPNTPTFSPAKSTAFSIQTISFSATTPTEEAASCCSSKNDEDQKKGFSLIRALRYGFITLLGDIAIPLFWGLIIGALITVAIPDNLSEILKEYNWLSYLIVIAIAVPMYVCATASLPIAAGLMLSGVSAGAAFVFLSAGPATNTVTIGVVKKMLGTRSLYIYLGTIIVGSILFGLGLDWIFSAGNIDPSALIHMDENVGIFTILSSIMLWGMVLYFMAKPFFVKRDGDCCSGAEGCCES